MITLRSPSSRIAIHHLSLAALVLATACHPDADHAGTESATDDPAALARAGSPGTSRRAPRSAILGPARWLALAHDASAP